MFSFREEDNAPEKISLDDLYEGKHKRDMRILNTFNTVLGRVHHTIKVTARQKIDQQYCWFVIPEFMLGVPSYDHKDCAVFVIEKLKENGFLVKYTHPNLLLISWQHWVPGYVRQELKKKTGIEIDGHGKYKNKNTTGSKDSDTFPFVPNVNPLMAAQPMQSEQEQPTERQKDFKDIKSYNPIGGLVYKSQLMQDLHNKLK